MAEKKKYTKEGYQKLLDELSELRNVKLVEIAEAIKHARGFGDLSENAEYKAAKEEQTQTKTRIDELEELIKNAEVMTDEEIAKDIVSIGKTVTLKYKDGTEAVYHIVSSNEADPLNRKISDVCPIGKAIVGKKKGESVTIVLPRGVKDAVIVDYKVTNK